MLIVLPPSEGKTRPTIGPPVDLSALSRPALAATRTRVLAALTSLCRRPAAAATALGLGPRQADEIADNLTILERPSAPAIEVYSGVLYDALAYATLPASARRRGAERLAISSALWGLVRPDDRVTSYRLSAGVTLPRVGTIASAWRRPVAAELDAEEGLIVDLRSGAYIALGPVPAGARERTVQVRVLHEVAGRRTVVSHFNKATKGRIACALIQQTRAPSSVDALMSALGDHGFTAEHSPATRARPHLVDVVVTAT